MGTSILGLNLQSKKAKGKPSHYWQFYYYHKFSLLHFFQKSVIVNFQKL